MTQRRRALPSRLRRLRKPRLYAWASGLLLVSAGCFQTRVFPPAAPSSTLVAISTDPTTTAQPQATSPYAAKPGTTPNQTAKSNYHALPSPMRATAKPISNTEPITQVSATEVVRQRPVESKPAPTLPAEEPTRTQQPQTPEPLSMPAPALPDAGAPAEKAQIPISLDTVFRLAEEQNAQVALARERVNEAYAEKCIAQQKWLPDIYVGTAYYRHEGGIQLQEGSNIYSSTGANFNGLEIDGRFDIREFAYQKVNAQRKVWQQKGELTKITSETLLDAASTYIDMLAARTAEAIVREEREKFTELLKQAKGAADDLLPQADITRIESEIEGQNQLLAKLRSQSAAAAAKLMYLLQLDPACELIPVDQQLVPFDLIDIHMSAADLVEHALRNGPGVNEMEGLLATIQEAMSKSKSTEYWPILEARVAEGLFGAGPGSSSVWNNRWDLGLQARWNLTSYLTRCDRMRAAQAKVSQAHVAYQDLRGKLTAGVQEAHITSAATKQQIEHGAAQIDKAKESYTQSNLRRTDRPTRYPFTDVFLAIGTLSRARLGYVLAVSEHNKAQVRLMVLLGPGASRAMGVPCW